MTENASGPEFAPIKNTRLSEVIIAQIASLVERGHIELNQRFPSERELQERWRVSRPVLREAFRVLEMRGVVESRQGGGRYLRSTHVIDPSRVRTSELAANRDVLLRIWEAREAVETKLAELAAQRATTDQLAAIERPLLAIALEPAEKLMSLDLNGEFHAAIARAASNPILEEFSERLLQTSKQVGFKSIVGLQDWRALQGEHQPIFEAIRQQDPASARQAMAAHFHNLRLRVLEASS
ncbi:FCD domain-containing protein [Devosia sp. 919]|uniref:FadR/GntR family transcriptional regulator n=1 Tax=Devosia sp. 919 TaxID=2726065 RepID=UPI0015568F4D|nr:FCD domain-containing protein [Devosia sp. 919]